MKKRYQFTFILLVLFLTALCLTGCNTRTGGENNADNEIIDWKNIDFSLLDSKERAETLIKACDQEMDKLDSYTITSTIPLNFEINNIPIEISSNTEIQFMGQNSENFQYKSQTINKSKANGSSTSEIISEGFKDGIIYRRYQSGELENTLKSNISATDFINYL